jgi:(p)ppGpp synthase/HD superfamily hydrolase
MINHTIIWRAEKFARDAHLGQLRTDGRPYIVHPEQVFLILRTVTQDPEILAAGWLHDVIEDTDTTYKTIVDLFGLRVAKLVMEVTHDTPQHFPRLKSKEGMMIKFADRLSNLSDMNGWDQQRQQAYMDKSIFWKTGEKS